MPGGGANANAATGAKPASWQEVKI